MPITRKQYSPERKTTIVKKFIKDRKKNPALTIAARANQLHMTSTVLRRWIRDPRFGGDPNYVFFGGRGKVRKDLPIVQSASQRRARPLLATRFVCPHCGEPITVGGNHA